MFSQGDQILDQLRQFDDEKKYQLRSQASDTQLSSLNRNISNGDGNGNSSPISIQRRSSSNVGFNIGGHTPNATNSWRSINGTLNGGNGTNFGSANATMNTNISPVQASGSFMMRRRSSVASPLMVLDNGQRNPKNSFPKPNTPKISNLTAHLQNQSLNRSITQTTITDNTSSDVVQHQPIQVNSRQAKEIDPLIVTEIEHEFEPLQSQLNESQQLQQSPILMANNNNGNMTLTINDHLLSQPYPLPQQAQHQFPPPAEFYDEQQQQHTYTSLNIKEDKPRYVPPINFSTVESDLYRSGHPQVTNYPFLESLHLKTILYIGDKTDNYDYYKWISQQEGISFRVFKLKKIEVDDSQWNDALNLLLNKRNYPMLIHSNKGKHRVGVLVGLIRKYLQGWTLSGAFDEYSKFSREKGELDLEFIETFKPVLKVDLVSKPDFVRL
ncbi:unnamed protein product [Ambrosiozyma monospora]|uniref:Putative tyrosine-protein phosphatase OCA1 n=1 Tax=Ambrosiozyma monospora TaxID=43982 RepID=A0A9W7DDT6_AMBMO|nr:unnamed protein product [Ambrosiozyma monospora]